SFPLSSFPLEWSLPSKREVFLTSISSSHCSIHAKGDHSHRKYSRYSYCCREISIGECEITHGCLSHRRRFGDGEMAEEDGSRSTQD
ncbi:hypothetical protein PMAYCL1PPCAC_18008, partial [Pristionchus mayeri]